MVFLWGLVSVLPNGFAWLVYFLFWSSRFVWAGYPAAGGVAGLPASHVARIPFFRASGEGFSLRGVGMVRKSSNPSPWPS